MTTKAQDRLLGLTLIALSVTIGGEMLGMTLLTTVGVTGFFIALLGQFVLMTVALVGGVGRRSGRKTYDPVLADQALTSTPSKEH